jgi:competence protein ComEC
MHRNGNDAFALREWLAADADDRLPTDPTLRGRIACDDSGCIARLADGRLVALVLTPDAFPEDCRRAALVVTPRQAPPRCAALVIDRQRVRASGAVALRRAGEGWTMEAARPHGQDRPWARAVPGATDLVPTPGPRTRPSRDATPRLEDLDPGDAQ